jgi:hypothetical protein
MTVRISSLCRCIAVGVSVIVASLTGASTASATGMAPVYDPYSNAYLYLVGSTSTTTGTWLSAESQAQALGGNLVTIHSAAENQFLSNTFFQNLTSQGGPNLSTAYVLWMGLYDPTGAIADDGAQHAANFVWANGETSSYRNWDTGEPNDGNGGPHEYYGGMWGPDAQVLVEGGVPTPLGTWDDLPNLYPGPAVPSQGFYGIAEVPVPEPATIGLLGVGAILAVVRGRRTPGHRLGQCHRF